MLAALGLTMTSAHVLEMPQKMAYSAESAWILTSLLKRRRVSYKWALTGAALLLLSFISWLILVEPVNLQIEAALAATPETIPSLWQALRNRWEYGHAIGFVLHLLGFCALVVSLIREGEGPAFVRRSPLPLA